MGQLNATQNYSNMISYYGFDSHEVELLETLMSPGNMVTLEDSSVASSGVLRVDWAEMGTEIYVL